MFQKVVDYGITFAVDIKTRLVVHDKQYTIGQVFSLLALPVFILQILDNLLLLGHFAGYQVHVVEETLLRNETGKFFFRLLLVSH